MVENKRDQYAKSLPYRTHASGAAISIAAISCIEKRTSKMACPFFLYRVKSDYSSTTTGLYFGTRVFMMIHPMR